MPKSLVYIFVLVIVALFLLDGNYRGAFTVGLTLVLFFIVPYWVKTATQAKAINIIRSVWILGLCAYFIYESMQTGYWGWLPMLVAPLIIASIYWISEWYRKSPTQTE